MTNYPGKLMLAVVGSMLSAAGAAEEWVELTPGSGDAPTPRAYAASIYDPVSHRMIVFGGQTSSGDVSDVWAFDLAGGTWEELVPGPGPVPAGRFTANAVYDPQHHAMVVWSGQGSGAFLNDVWSFDLDDRSWSQFLPPSPLPNIRYGTAAVFDPVTRELVTFGGFTNQGRFDDTWRFDVDGVQWTDVTPPAGSPSARCLHSASYDALEHRMIMYGGTPGPRDDVWAFDLATGSWADLTPAVRPDGRYFTAHVHDAIRHRSVVVGGSLALDWTDEVWAFDLATETWEQLSPSGTGPTAGGGVAAIYVLTEDRMILFGGDTTASLRNDVWSLDFAPSGSVVFPWPIVADADRFRWPVAANVDYVRADLDAVPSYAFDVAGSETHASSFSDTSVPAPGAGYAYLVRLAGDRGSWQTSPGAQPLRDTALP